MLEQVEDSLGGDVDEFIWDAAWWKIWRDSVKSAYCSFSKPINCCLSEIDSLC